MNKHLEFLKFYLQLALGVNMQETNKLWNNMMDYARNRGKIFYFILVAIIVKLNLKNYFQACWDNFSNNKIKFYLITLSFIDVKF